MAGDFGVWLNAWNQFQLHGGTVSNNSKLGSGEEDFNGEFGTLYLKINSS